MTNARWAELRASVRRFRTAWIVGFGLLSLSGATRAIAEPNPARDRSTVYHTAVAYLRSVPHEQYLAEDGRGVSLAEAVLADRLVLGPRSTTLLSSLDLDSVDSRARRVRALADLGLDVQADVQVLLAELSKPRPNRIALDPILRANATTLIGAPNFRLPIVFDNALAIRALHSAGVTAAQSTAVEDALLYLLEAQRSNGSWNLVRSQITGTTPAPKLVFVSAEALRALLPYRTHTFSASLQSGAQSVGIDTDVPDAIADAIGFLKSTQTSNTIDRAMRLIALLEAVESSSLPPTDSFLASETLALVTTGLSTSGAFGNSPLAASLVAQALLKGSKLPQLPQLVFDRDGDGLADGPDPDSDNDGSCDPGESHASCTGSDAFPLDSTEQVDTDHDGIGDGADADLDGDGVCDSGQSGPGCTGQDQFATNSREHSDFDGDGIPDVADADDDGDGVSDVDEMLDGTDPEDVDTDGDTFGDKSEHLAGTDGASSNSYRPDGDIFPLGTPDGLVDLRDALLAIRVLDGDVVVSGPQQTVFIRHADVAPKSPSGTPVIDGAFGVGDAFLILQEAAAF